MTITKFYNWTLTPCNGNVKLTAEEDGKIYLAHISDIKDDGDHLTVKTEDVFYILVK